MRIIEFILVTLLTVMCSITFIVGLWQLSSGAMYEDDNVTELSSKYTYSDDYAVVQPGFVFASKKGFFYYKVTNPEDYEYITQEVANRRGYRLDPNGSTVEYDF